MSPFGSPKGEGIILQPESIVNTPNSGTITVGGGEPSRPYLINTLGMGRWTNGGGGGSIHSAGGGGGSNIGSWGGRGGFRKIPKDACLESPCGLDFNDSGGLGGEDLSVLPNNRIIMGGAGGHGHFYKNLGTSTYVRGNGGGIVFLHAQHISFNSNNFMDPTMLRIDARGGRRWFPQPVDEIHDEPHANSTGYYTANDFNSTFTTSHLGDISGGGGAGGGTILLEATNITINGILPENLSFTVKGGNGASLPAKDVGTCCGPGGGGGGGRLLSPNGAFNLVPQTCLDISGGIRGANFLYDSDVHGFRLFFPNCNNNSADNLATDGSPGQINNAFNFNSTEVQFTVNITSDPPTPIKICQGQPITLTSDIYPTSISDITYSWTINSNEQMSTNNSFSINTTGLSGVYTVTLICTGMGCTNITSMVVTEIVFEVYLPEVNIITSVPCIGQPLTLFADVTIPSPCENCTYFWTGPSFFFSNETNPMIFSATMANSGNYTVMVNSNGCTGTATVNVMINPNPRVTLAVTPNPICAGDPVTFTTNVTPENLNYNYLLFSPGGVLVGEQQNNPIFNFLPGNNLQSGNYTIMVVNLATNCFATAQVNLVVNSVPAVNAWAVTDPICAGQVLSLTSVTTGGCDNGCTYNWVGPNVTTPNQPNITITAPNITNQSLLYSLTVTNMFNCITTVNVPVTVNPVNRGVNLTVAPNPVCQGNSITLTAQILPPPGQPALVNDGPYTYTYDNITNPGAPTSIFGGQTPNGQNTITIPTSISGTFTYQATVTNASGCTLTSLPVTVTVNPLPTFDIGVSLSPVCAGGPVILTSNTTGGCNGDCSYQWTGPDGGTIDNSDDKNTNATPPAVPGTYTYNLMVSNPAGCSNTQSITVTVSASLPITITPPSSLCAGQEVTLTAASDIQNGSYNWTFSPELLFSSNGETVTFTPMGLNSITITANVTANGCQSVGQTTVQAQACCPAPTGPGVTVITETLASDFIANNGGNPIFTGQMFVFPNDFVVDNNITFNGCGLYFDPDKRLTVNDGITFNANNSTLTACDCLWGGIVAVDNDATVTLNNSIVENAFVGLEGRNGAQVTITNSTFQSNYTNIGLSNYLDAPADRFVLTGSTIQNAVNLPDLPCTTSLTLPLPFQPWTGVQAYDCNNINVGDPGTTKNTFKNLYAGVALSVGPTSFDLDIAHSVRNNDFSNDNTNVVANNLTVGVSAQTTSGTPIWSIAQSHTLKIGDIDNVDAANSFLNVGQAIETQGYRTIDIGRNLFSRVGSGVSVSRVYSYSNGYPLPQPGQNFPPETPVNIGYNTGVFQLDGIKLQNITNYVSDLHTPMIPVIFIHHNNLAINNDMVDLTLFPLSPAKGISTNGFALVKLRTENNTIDFSDQTTTRENIGVFFPFALRVYTVNDNKVKFTNASTASTGISVNLNGANQSLYEIKNNVIGEPNAGRAHIGIEANGSAMVSPKINLNTVYIRSDQAIFGGTYNAGIQLSNLRGFQVRTNKIYAPELTAVSTHGIRVSATSTALGSDVQCNEITKCENGITMDGQGSNTNVSVWNNSLYANKYGIRLQNGAMLGDQGTDNSTGEDQPSDNKWIDLEPGTHFPTAKDEVPDNPKTRFLVRNISSDYEPTVTPFCYSIGSGGFAELMAVDSPQPAIDCGTLATGAPIPPPNPNYPPIGLALGRMAYDSLTFSSNVPQSRYLSKRNLFNWLKTYPSLLTQNAKFVQQYDSLKYTNLVAFADVDTFIAHNDFLSARAANNAINPAPGGIETNQKITNDILLYYLIAQETGQYQTGQPVLPTDPPFTPVQYSRISGVAAQCPHIGGIAVYTARAMKTLADGRPTRYADNCTPNYPPYRLAQEQKVKPLADNDFMVYPNPAKESFTINVEMKQNLSAEIEIFDILGKNMLRRSLNNGETTIDVHTWTQGVYFFVFTSSDGNRKITKLVVQ